MKHALIFNIQRFSIHDGPGIRTTLFFKGCPLKCRWCHNPESWKTNPEILYDSNKCALCLKCLKACNKNRISFDGTALKNNPKLICEGCGDCYEVCLNEAREVAGINYTVKDLVEICEKDRAFYEESGGGVTFSGGEPLMQIDIAVETAKKLNERGISVTIDTSGFVPEENLKKIMPFTDLFLYDLKIMDDDLHIKYTGKSNRLILENLRVLSKEGKKIWLRIPVISGVNDNEDNFNLLIDFMDSIKTKNINLLPYHSIAEGKSEKTEIKGTEKFNEPDEKFILSIKKRLENIGFKVAIGG